ncbi:MAG: hypothetical protein DSZ28_06365 [Thiothrix sp.]|nr:MAG: hypothetical protein DSZ28_06365 [Thiothrix sp.]
MELWEQILLGAAALLILLFFGPGANRALKNAPPGNSNDWMTVAKLIAVVVLFVIVLIALVRQ